MLLPHQFQHVFIILLISTPLKSVIDTNGWCFVFGTLASASPARYHRIRQCRCALGAAQSGIDQLYAFREIRLGDVRAVDFIIKNIRRSVVQSQLFRRQSLQVLLP